MPTRRILFLGDVCSEAGRRAVASGLSRLREEMAPDFVAVNVENAAGGRGITARLGEEIIRAGADCMTTGDHAFDRRESWRYFDDELRLLRPLNYPDGTPGRGCQVFEKDDFKVAVVNALGRVFLRPLDCPFRALDRVLPRLREQTPVIVVDFHAEATAEKQALGWYLDGRVSAVLGTHTHVQTADERLLHQGTAYITDVGMCGAFDSVLGMRKEQALSRVLDLLPTRLHPATGELRLNGVLVEVDDADGRALGIRRVNFAVEGVAPDEEKHQDTEGTKEQGRGQRNSTEGEPGSQDPESGIG